MANFLNTDGLSALWAKIKSKFYTKTEVDAAIPNASTTTPLMDGTAATGSSTNYARADHVHPSDTSKANVADVLGKTNTTSYTPTGDYNPATKKYVDDSISGFSTTLSGLTDTTISSPTEGQVLSYDATNEVWVNANSTDNIFLITVTYAYNSSTGEYDYSVDKTYNEIVAARNAGKICLAKQGSTYYYYKDENNSMLLFVSFYKMPYYNKYEIYNLTITSTNNVNTYNFEIPQKISDLNNVSVSSPYDGQSLIYNSTNQKWQNGSIPLTNLSDTTISSPTNGQVLTYDSTTSKWINTNALTETRVNELIVAALAQYGDGDTASYGYTDASEVNY